MAYTRKQAVTTVSVLYLLLVTALSGYAASCSSKLSLPLPNSLSFATTLLPFVSALLLEFGYDLTRRHERRQRLNRGETQRPLLVIIANTLIFIYSSVVITLLGTHAVPPSGLDCGLRERWQRLYQRKDAEAVRTIQDALKCCGLANSRDMAWPFPNKSNKVTACEEAFGHMNGCLAPWKSEEQRMAGVLMVVVGLVFLWQLAIIVAPTQKESWLHKVLPERVSRIIASENSDEGADPRRAIDFLPTFNRYSDRVEEEDSDNDVGNRTRKALHPSTENDDNLFLGGSSGERQQGMPDDLLTTNEWSQASH